NISHSAFTMQVEVSDFNRRPARFRSEPRRLSRPDEQYITLDRPAQPPHFSKEDAHPYNK
ncbi:hypothetical protein MO973_26295, partial [Paenibacillus sp. TRM 82003]|nr:hypothetical protein [Paenibacillus sp. TRM 82003]